MMMPTLRVARESVDLDALLVFYRDGLGMAVLSRFADHPGGYDGLILGWPNAPYHLEFTRRRGHRPPRRGGEEDLLVFYIEDDKEWQTLVERMRRAGIAQVKSANAWWERAGATFEDPDGYRVVLQRSAWTCQGAPAGAPSSTRRRTTRLGPTVGPTSS